MGKEAAMSIKQDMDNLDNFGWHLCKDCRPRRMRLLGITGECGECGRMTSDSAYKLCRACAERGGVCQLQLCPPPHSVAEA